MRGLPLSVCAVLSAAFLTGGCGETGYFFYLFAPRPAAEKVPAEFDHFPGQRVAVVIHSDPAVDYEYPGCRLALASMIANGLTKNVENVSVVDPRKMARYQSENLYWDEMERTKLGRELQADYVLYISLVEYSMREPGSVGLYRGRITAEVSVYDTALPERDARVYRGQDVAVTYPPHSPGGDVSEDERKVRRTTEDLFVDAVAKQFYQHEVAVEE